MEEPKREKYINPFTDFGFKRLFGEEMNKDILIDFLSELLRDQVGQIIDLQYKSNEKRGRSEEDRRAIFDIYCENKSGERFLIEMQKSKQAFFKDRTLYYSTFPIQEQAQLSDWNYQLKAVFTIGILDFMFEEGKEDMSKFRYDVKLSDIETHKVFYDKLTFVYLEMPKFTKQIAELNTHFEKWLYVLKNLHKLDRLPDTLREQVFERVFSVAEIAKFTPQEFHEYEDSLKSYRDLQNSIDTARNEGKAEGLAEGEAIGEAIKTEKVILKAHSKGMSIEDTAELAEVSVAEVMEVLAKHGLL
jgi:predicted transposase/invertase (TIGR01784 family)